MNFFSSCLVVECSSNPHLTTRVSYFYLIPSRGVCSQGYADFASLVKMCLNQPVCDRLTFLDFVNNPLRRLTKYPLLLKVYT